MVILDSKEMKIATKSDGEIGPAIRSTKRGAHLAGVIGVKIPVKSSSMGTSGTVGIMSEHRNSISIPIQISMLKWIFLVIPKDDIIEWGVLDLESVPIAQTPDHSSAIAGLLLYGPIGLLVGSAMDNSASKRKAKKPVIGITYHSNSSESSIFIDFQINSWFYEIHDFMMSFLPEKHKQ